MKLRTLLFATFFLGLFSIVSAQETEWKIDKSHSSITFKVKHFKIATVKGIFEDFSGTIVSDGKDFSDAEFNVTIQTESLNTNQTARDKHLRSADFFDAEKNKEITFKSTSVTKKSDDTYSIKGDLTMNGVTNEFEFIGEFKGSFVHPRFKKTIGVLQLTGTVPRLDYKVGTKFPNAALSTDVDVTVEIEMIQSAEAK
jgi:polyisoprenoid-binding protein YceI